jgi:hypothetical protein
VRAYVLAKKLPEEMHRDDKTRMDAQYLYQDDAVETLLERLRYRDRHAAMDRVAKLTLRTVENGLKAAEVNTDVLKVAATLMGVDQRAREADTKRRDVRAMREAMNASRQNLRDSTQPPSLEEFKHSLVMAIELFGIQTVRECITAALPIDVALAPAVITLEVE